MNETLDKSVIAMNELINLPVFLTSAEKYGKAHMGKPASCNYIFCQISLKMNESGKLNKCSKHNFYFFPFQK